MERKTKPTMSKLRLPFFRRLKGWGDASSAFISASADALILFDKSLNFVRLNVAAEKLANLLGEDVVGKNILDVVPNIKETGRYDKYLNVIETGKPFSTEDIVPHPKFGNIHLSVRAFKAGNGLGMIISDITRLSGVGEALRGSEEKYRAIVETTIDGIYQVDTSGKLVFINESFARTFGYKREELLGKHFSSLLSAETFPEVKEMVEKVLAGENVSAEVSVQHKDGHKVPVSSSATPLKANGNVIGLAGILRDVTGHKQMNEALRKQAYDIGERVKEISCIQAISGIVSKPDVSLEEMLQGIVDVIPSGWQYPEITSARISSGDQEFITKNFRVTNWKQSSDIIVHGNRTGTVEVCYLEEKPEMDEGPFLKEERALINVITERLGSIIEHKEAEEELAKSEAKYRSLIDTAGAGVATIDLTGKLILVNKALCRMFGYSQEELLGRNFADFLHPDDKENVLDIFAKGLAGERERPHLEFRVIHKDGHSVWCNSSLTAIVQGDEIAGFSTIIYDITERKKMEDALQFTRFSLDSTTDTMVCVNRDARLIDLNDAFCRAVGYSREELLSMTVHDIDPNYSAKIWSEFWEKLKRSGSLTFESCHRRRDGKVFPVEVTVTFFEYKGKEYHCGFAHDITERKKAEEALRDSEEKWRSLTENSPDYIMLLDLDSTILFINRTVPDLTKEEVIGTPNLKYIPPEYRQSVADCYKRVAASGKPDMHTTVYRTKEGESRWFEVRVAPVLKNGQVVAFVSSSTDITEHKRAEQTLQESEERFRRVLDNAIDMIYWVNLKTGTYDYVAPSSEKVIGYTPDEFIALGIAGGRSLAHPDDLGRLDENVVDLLMNAGNGNAPSAIEYRFTHKKLGYRWMSDNRSIVYDGDEPVAIVGSLRDITERKKTEEELWSTRERLQLIFDSVDDGIAVTDLEGFITEVNKRGLEMYAASTKPEVIGKSALELIVPEEREKAMAQLQIVLEQGATGLIEHNVVRADGSQYMAELNASVLKNVSGNTTGFVVVLRDITERGRMVEALRQSEAKLRIMFEAIVEGVTVTNLQGNMVQVNEAVLRLHGYSRKEEILGRNAFELISPKDHIRAQDNMRKTLEEGQIQGIEYTFLTKDGKEFEAELTAAVLEDKSGNATGLIALTRDITERKQMEEALRQSEARFRAIFERSALGIGLVDVKGRLISINTTLETMIGYTIDELCSMAWTDYIHPEDATADMGLFREMVVGKRDYYTMEKRYLKKDREIVWGRMTLSAVRDSSGKFQFAISMVEDITKSKQAEGLLRESESKFRNVLEHSVDVIYQLNPKTGTYDYVSPSSIKALGYSSEELRVLGFEKATSVIHPDDVEMIREHFNKLMKRAAADDKESPTIEYRVKHKKLGYRWMSDTSSVLHDDNNVPIAIIGNIHDITQRKIADESLKESEERYRALVDTAGLAGEGIMIVERAEGNKAIIAFVNDTLSGMLGYQREEMLGMLARDLFLPGDRMWLQEKNRRRRKEEALPSHYGVMALRKDGSMLPIEISMGVMRYEDKSATVIYVRDVTERKQAEDSLQKSEERFRSLIENTSEVVLIVDKDAIITYASPSAERVLGYKPEETIGKISFSFIHEDNMPEVMKLYDQAMQNPAGITSAEVRVRHKDGSWRVAEGIGTNLLDNPAIGGIVVNFRDVTERERAHEELLRHTRQVEALHAIAQLASQTLELEELLNTALDKVIEVMEAEAGCVYLLDTVEKELVLKTHRGISDDMISRVATIKLNENNVQKIKEWKGGSTPLREIFEETGLTITKEAKEKEQIQSFAVAPFAVRGQLSGLIAVGNRADRKFSPGDIDLLRAVGNQIGIGTQNAMLYEEVRALIRETIDAQETERERICLEVHDGVAQTLVAAFQYLQALEATLPDDTKGSPLLAKATAQVKQAIQESREIINSLQPATLSDLGLVSTLRHELKRLGQETGLKIDFKADAIRLSKDIEIGLYRIIHEAIANARKHADTRRLRVKINSEDGGVRVEVRDWGKGFDQVHLDRARRRGTGLFSIRKRAELLKGTCEIQSKPGEGTTVHVEIPFSAAEISSG